MVTGVLDLVVDMIALVSDALSVGGDVGILVLDVRCLGVDIGGRRADNARCLTMEDALERVSAAVCLEAPRATGGVERRIIGGFGEIDQCRTWIVEEPYDIASLDIGGLLDFLKPPRAVKGMVPNGGSDRQRSG